MWQRGKILLLFLPLVVVAGVVLFLASPALSLQTIIVHRESLYIDVEEVQRLLAPSFGEHLLFLSRREHERILRDALPEVSSVRIRKRYPSTLEVTLYLVPLAARAIVVDPDATDHDVLSTGTGVLLSDGITLEGVYLSFSVPVEPSLPLLYIVDWGVRPVHRQPILSPEEVGTLLTSLSQLQEDFGFQPEFTILYLRGREFHVRTNTLLLWFDFVSPLEEQLQRLRTFLRTLPPGEVQEYVDLRLHNQIIYR